MGDNMGCPERVVAFLFDNREEVSEDTLEPEELDTAEDTLGLDTAGRLAESLRPWAATQPGGGGGRE